MRFPKAVRLTRASEFAEVKAKGRTMHGRHLLLGVLPKEGAARVGLVTSRRVGNAVERNLVRRRLREIVRLARPTLADGRWMVIIAKASAARVKYAEIAEEWAQLARKAGCFRP